MPALRLPALLLASAGLLISCAGSSATFTPSSAPASGRPFVSTLYRYTVTAPDWTGTMATAAWDGTGSPGSGDPTVDTLTGPIPRQAFVYGEPTTGTLTSFVAGSRAANATVHQCPVKPERTRPITVAHEPAILDEMHCPAGVGVFSLTAFVKHGARVYVFFTYDQPGKEAAMRAWFGSLLQTVSFNQ